MHHEKLKGGHWIETFYVFILLGNVLHVILINELLLVTTFYLSNKTNIFDGPRNKRSLYTSVWFKRSLSPALLNKTKCFICLSFIIIFTLFTKRKFLLTLNPITIKVFVSSDNCKSPKSYKTIILSK